MGIRRAMIIAVMLLLAGCGHATWTRAGADAADSEAALRQCRGAAAAVVGPEEGIDQDILATRQTDWQRSQVGGLAAGRLGQETHERADRIVAACMRANGFVLAKPPR